MLFLGRPKKNPRGKHLIFEKTQIFQKTQEIFQKLSISQLPPDVVASKIIIDENVFVFLKPSFFHFLIDFFCLKAILW